MFSKSIAAITGAFSTQGKIKRLYKTLDKVKQTVLTAEKNLKVELDGINQEFNERMNALEQKQHELKEVTKFVAPLLGTCVSSECSTGVGQNIAPIGKNQ